MITIIKSSKRTIRKTKISLSASDAKKFLFKLDDKQMIVDNYYLFSADTQDELIDVVGFFSPSYLKTVVYEGFEVYTTQQEISKDRRTRHSGATITAIENFIRKIKAHLLKTTNFYDEDTVESSVGVQYQIDVFTISIEFPISEAKMIFVYDYSLQLQQAYITPRNLEKDIPTIVIANITKHINAVFNKQRYYYKKKGEKNAKDHQD